ncbi:recombinase family protein [Candidatus Nomurabacteria bacterium]|nr:recombinase family protein [Candidatus Nomurabacteria bacterium]
MTDKLQKALIYCRVSSEKQKTEGHGLDSQEQRCREYAKSNNYEVIRVFRDSFTGGGDYIKRPEMSMLLDFLDTNRHEEFVIIFDDLKRFARDTIFHWKLRTELNSRGATLKCLNFSFEDTPEGEFIETILAAQGELERKQNGRQVIQKQKARLENGYWAFGRILGYTQEKHSQHGNLLTPKEPEASQIKEVLEGFASGRFKTKKDMANFLVSQHFRGRKRIHFDTVDRLFNIVYAGFIEYKPWGVEVRKGFHQPIISLDTWEINQAKLFGRKQVRTRSDTNPDFPLRNLLLCSGCCKPLTASWTKGRSDRYPYYRCNQKHCEYGSKSINREDLHPLFESELEKAKPDISVLNLAHAIAVDVWNKKQKELFSKSNKADSEKRLIQKKIDTFMDRITNTDNQELISIYEDKIQQLSEEKVNLIKLQKNIEDNNRDFGTAFNNILEKIKNPKNTWENGTLDDKREVFNLVYSEPIVFDWEKGFGTAKMSPVYELFEAISNSNSEYVEMGPEPVTSFRFGAGGIPV